MGTRVTENFGGAQLHHAKGIADARRKSPPVRLLFPHRWQRERARRVHRICGCIEHRRERGQSLREAVWWFAWYWRDRCYRSEPGRRMRLRASTIVRLFYQWKENGKTPAAVAHRYGAISRKLPASQVLELARLCVAPGVRSFCATWSKVESPAATASAFWHAAPAEVRKRLAALCAARRHVEYLERVAQKAVDKFAEAISGQSK